MLKINDISIKIIKDTIKDMVDEHDWFMFETAEDICTDWLEQVAVGLLLDMNLVLEGRTETFLKRRRKRAIIQSNRYYKSPALISSYSITITRLLKTTKHKRRRGIG